MYSSTNILDAAAADKHVLTLRLNLHSLSFNAHEAFFSVLILNYMTFKRNRVFVGVGPGEHGHIFH